MKLLINNVRIHVEIHGDDGPVLVLLHGFTGSIREWDPFIQSWKKDFRVIAIDLIGHGKSEHPMDFKRYSMEDAVRDIDEILNYFNVESAFFLGYSLGGRVALSLAMTYPNRVKKLILESASPGLESEEARSKRRQQDHQLADRIKVEGIESFVTYWESIPLFAPQQRLPEAKRDQLRARRLENSTVGLANSLRGMGTGEQPSWWGRLTELTVPTLLVVGELDQKFCVIAEQMSERLPNSRMVVVENAGHTVHLEQIKKFDKIVIEELHNRKDV
ncbi:2-succinyl-6-hydroxy-2,4-cyclohexadiene-1-carboxylate synthase [Alkalihalobacillus sp. AL-G]|uniref:2-succinyl-6-hydroxy-2, 4-cyclohexadiene-1-carboxylate synthase n=1 Tax=Alkalihalobacillus sp. AL-G TaxID=2926399 RepID=UPI00272AAE69|nr:2-succinyl-6-hydroxy-2,4-cyclohexadiene-1-carboxylate synthase [Alkalihalobacillus sp. AL-G]WLD92477.1 2-succinyl-6-hydroxy-2,4-cyclohexadiene-1-carboxylate synthase [Alkalihalobacillus sp. AL-G]